MTSREIALGLIESATKAGIELEADGDVLVVSYAAGSEPHDSLYRLIRECRADILAALQKGEHPL